VYIFDTLFDLSGNKKITDILELFSLATNICNPLLVIGIAVTICGSKFLLLYFNTPFSSCFPKKKYQKFFLKFNFTWNDLHYKFVLILLYVNFFPVQVFRIQFEDRLLPFSMMLVVNVKFLQIHTNHLILF
jgi:hypothetical protein